MRIIWTLLFIALLSGCASISQHPTAKVTQISWQDRESALKQLQVWQLNGKIGIITAQTSGSATINWQENHGHYLITLAGPFGAGALKLTGQPGNVTLETANGQKMTASTPEQLLANAWGWQLPVSYLAYWVRGLPAPDVAADKQFDTAGRLSMLTQQGWQVTYLGYSQVGLLDLPEKITISSNALKTKIIIYRWAV